MDVADQKRLIPELVWVPTYLSFAVLMTTASTIVYDLVLIPLLIATRVVLELVYRLAFGEQRHTWACRLMAFTAQLVMWAAFWAYLYVRQRAAA